MIISEGGWFIDVFSVASSLRLAKQRCQLSFGFSSLAMVAMSFSGHRHRCYLDLVANYPILDRPIFAFMGRCFEEFATSTEWLEKMCCWGGSEMPNGSKIALRPQISWRQRYGARRAFESPAIMAADFLRPIDLGFPLVPRFPGHGAQLGLSKKRVKVASCYMAFTAHAASSCDWSNSFILSQIKPALWGWVHRRKSKSHSKGRRLQKAEEESERYLRQLTLRWISDDISMGQTGWHSTVNGSVSRKYFRGTCQCWALWMSTKPWLYRGRSCWQSICCGWAPPKCFPVLARKGWWQNEAIELHYKWWKGVSLSPSP